MEHVNQFLQILSMLSAAGYKDGFFVYRIDLVYE
jgi:hypothetical protein